MNFAVQWRKPAQPKGKSPLAILFHGRTSNERDIMAQAGSAIPERVAVASLRGPIPLDEGGYTWFVNRGLGRPVGESLRASVDRIHDWIDGIDVAEFDTPGVVACDGVGWRDDLRFSIEKFEDALAGSHGRLQDVVFIAEVLDRAEETLRVLDEGDEDAEGYGAEDACEDSCGMG